MHIAENARLQIRLLGTFSALLDGASLVRFRSAKVRALLAYLAVEPGRAHRREALATLLWGEFPQHDAQRSLSQALSNLRSLLAALAPDDPSSGPVLAITGQSVQFEPDQAVWVDVHAFDSLLAAADLQRTSVLDELDVSDLLTEAAALYRGPFLAGLSLPDSREYEEWLVLQREQRHQAMMLALERLVSHHLSGGRTDRAGHYARRQLALEPWSESGHQGLMLALALEGQRAAALQQYHACRRVLAEELGIEPSAATEALARQIRDGVPLQAAAASGPSALPFVAREPELAQLDRALKLALAGQGRVMMVSGEAGTGKTALLDYFARYAQERHRRLAVAGGRCGAYAGLGDPLLPFREILQGLTGEVQAVWPGGRADPEHARRLAALFPQAAEALLAEGPDLIGRLVSAESLATRAEALGSPVGAWRGRLADHTDRARRSSPGSRAGTGAPPQQEALFGQVARLLQAIARQQPLLLLIDDLQWADTASLSLLFYMGRQLEGSRILVAGAYRPSEISRPYVHRLGEGGRPAGPSGQEGDDRHPLAAIVHEFGRLWGDVHVDLDQAGGRRFVDALLDGEPNRLGESFRDRLARHTGGHALFTVELLRAFKERGDLRQDEEGRWVEGPELRWQGLPPRVEAVIAERVGRLSREGRRLLEVASVEGESFSAEVAARAMGAEPEWALQWLSGTLSAESRLVQALGIQSLSPGCRPLSRYRFAHALFAEYLYGRLDAVDRAHLHGEVGAALEGLCAGDEVTLAQASPQLAQHYEAAGRVLEAARYRLEAGRWASRLVAYEEAIAHLERGLALLEGLPASPERLRLELRLCMAIGMSAMLQRGWQVPVYKWALERLSDLTQHMDLQDDPQRLTALHVLALSAGWTADPERSGTVGLQLLDLAHSAGLPSLRSGQAGQVPSAGLPSLRSGRAGQAQDGDQQTLMLGHWALGFSLWLRGQPAPAREHLSRALALYDPEANRPLGGLVPADLGVMAQAILGAVRWQLGYPEQGRASLGQAVAQAQALQQPSSVVLAQHIALMAASSVGRDVAAAVRLSEALRQPGKVSLVYGTWAEMAAVWAQVHGGQAPSTGPSAGPSESSGKAPSTGLPPLGSGQTGQAPSTGSGQVVAGTDDVGLQKSLARALEAGSTWQAAGSGGGYAGLMLLQADVCARSGQVEMGLESIERAQAWIERTGMRATEAEAWRIRGELLLALTHVPSPTGRGEEAAACFARALDIARGQQARLFELRAALSLARLWQAQGRREEARELLSGIYGWFTEGFDTEDLVEAKALLEALE